MRQKMLRTPVIWTDRKIRENWFQSGNSVYIPFFTYFHWSSWQHRSLEKVLCDNFHYW